MQLLPRRFLNIALLAVTCASSCLPAWPTPKNTYLHISQAHHVLGPLDLFASTGFSVVKIEKMDCTAYIDARQKDPNVTLVCPRRKTYFQIPLSKFEYGLASTLDTISDMDWDPKFWKFFAKTEVCGFAADEYRYRGTVGVYERVNMAYIPGKKGETTVKSRVICLQTPQVTKAFCALLKKLEHNPVLGGIPLKMETAYAIGRPRDQLSTIKIAVEQHDEMKVPNLNGFARASTSAQIFYGPANVIDLLGK